MTDVKCKVKSCHYWDDGDICKADSIMVDNNPVARTNMEIGSMDLDTSATASGRGRSAGAGAKYGDNAGTNAGSSGTYTSASGREHTTGTGRGRTTDAEVGDLSVGTTGVTGRQGTGAATTAPTQNSAKTSHETLCSTFRPKGTGTEARH